MYANRFTLFGEFVGWALFSYHVRASKWRAGNVSPGIGSVNIINRLQFIDQKT